MCGFGHFFTEKFAIDILRVGHVLSDQLRIGGMRHRHTFEI